MSRKRDVRIGGLDRARDELFSHIHRCGVLQATEEQQVEWMEDTIDYIRERYPELSDEQLGELRAVGLRFCRPAVPYGSEQTAENPQGVSEAATSEAA